MPIDGFLNDGWRDALTLSSAVGVGLAILQIWKQFNRTKELQDAVERTLRKTAVAFNRYAAGNAKTFLEEAKIYVDTEKWHEASMRVGDLANHAAQIGQMESDNEWTALASKLRGWEATFRRMHTGSLPVKGNLPSKWHAFVQEVAAMIDRYHIPRLEGRDGL